MPLVFRRVVVRTEIPAAPPRLVADAPVLHAERHRRTVCRPLPHERARFVVIAIFDPVAHLAHAPAAEVPRKVWHGPDQPAEVDELVGAEVVVLQPLPP